MTKSSLIQNEQRLKNLLPHLFIYPTMNLAYKIVISKLLENVDDFAINLWFAIVIYAVFVIMKY